MATGWGSGAVSDHRTTLRRSNATQHTPDQAPHEKSHEGKPGCVRYEEQPLATARPTAR